MTAAASGGRVLYGVLRDWIIATLFGSLYLHTAGAMSVVYLVDALLWVVVACVETWAYVLLSRKAT